MQAVTAGPGDDGVGLREPQLCLVMSPGPTLAPRDGAGLASEQPCVAGEVLLVRYHLDGLGYRADRGRAERAGCHAVGPVRRALLDAREPDPAPRRVPALDAEKFLSARPSAPSPEE